ncbi:hypothetical protein HYX16_02905 [Candidatus Woesearchaeota archaeon]|nr:hypothetical protein [Candidatus Woesearchaeota archaeon]
MSYYFLTYKTDIMGEPYKLPDKLRKDLLAVKGLEIYSEPTVQPVVIINASENAINDIKILELIMKIEDDFDCRAVEGYL